LLLLAWPALSWPALAAQAVSAADIRSGNHPDFGRVVIDAGGRTSFVLDRDGDHAVLHLAHGMVLGPAPPPPRNVAALSVSGDTLDIALRPGVTLHARRMNGRVVVDVFGPAASPVAAKPAPVRTPKPPLNMARSPETGGRTSPPNAERPAVDAQPLPPAAETPAADPPLADPGGPVLETEHQPPPGRDTLPENEGPLDLRVRRIKLPKDLDGTAILVPFDATTGAAAFESTRATTVVFDERRPVDMAALADDPVFAAASVRLLPNGTVFTIPHKPGQSVVLTPLPRGWRIAEVNATPKLEPILASAADGRLNFAADRPGAVVSMADPETGATLLVGTQNRPGQGVASGLTSSEFIRRATSQGVVVEPLSDAIAMRHASAGFILSGGPDGLALSPSTELTAALEQAAHLTTRLQLPTMPRDALLRLSIHQLDDAAAARPLARGPMHRAAAESFLSLGMAAEAQSLLKMAAEQDPSQAASPGTEALTAIAALLAGRPEEAGGLADPRLDGTDEIALWRAIRMAMLDQGSPTAAAGIAAAAPLALQYPEPIRDRILPLMAETMIQGGALAPAAHLLALTKDDPHLAYARALMSQAEGHSAQALTMLDALAVGRDQFDRARAAVRAVEIRLASGTLDKQQAADALDKLLYAWRGDGRELALRERVADLRAQTGSWRDGLAALRQAEADFPGQAAAIHTRLQDMLAAMIHDPATDKLPPLEFIAAVEENADLLSDVGNQAVDAQLAERLLALDLPDRAKPVLAKLVKQAKSAVTKARYGLTLATLDAHEGDDAGALKVLDASEAPGLAGDLAEQRLILRADTIAHQGDPTAGAALLATVNTSPAIQARAQILENAGNWPAAEQAWADGVALALPADGVLDEPQARMVLRLTTATARAGDEAGLAGLRDRFGARMGSGPLADMFRLLTAAPVQTSGDIKRSQREMNLAASIPADLKALQPSTAPR
jgi:hypothetical protein